MSANLMSLARSGGKFLKLFGDRKMMKTVPTARDYVQDGLVAMWDGIENAGWGVHDPNATVWKDLVGGYDMNVVNGFFDENTFVGIKGGICSQAQSSVVETINTIEMCFRLSGFYKHYLQYLFGPYGSKGFGIAKRYEWCITRQDNSVGSAYLDEMTVLGTRAFSGGVNGRPYLNGVLQDNVPSFSQGTLSSDVCFVGSLRFNIFIKSIRCYSRALSAAEITDNYAIDKARFNLPD